MNPETIYNLLVTVDIIGWLLTNIPHTYKNCGVTNSIHSFRIC